MFAYFYQFFTCYFLAKLLVKIYLQRVLLGI